MPRLRPVFPLLGLALCLAVLLGGCAGKNAKKDTAKQSHYASADAKNVHDFLVKYPSVVERGDLAANMRLYADDARIVPFLSHVVRPIRSSEFSRRLPEILAEQRKAGLRIRLLEPMQIEAKSEQASVHVVAILSWQEHGKPQQAAMNCYFGLVRDENLLWKIREAHAEPVKSEFRLPTKPVAKKPLPPRDPMLRGKRVIKGEPPAPEPPKTPASTPQEEPSPPQAPPAPQDKPDNAQPAGGLFEKAPQPLF